VLIADRSVSRGRDYARAVEGNNQMSLMAAVTNLSEAYTIAEHRQPDLVALSGELATLPEFAMLAALIEMLGLKLLIYDLPKEDMRGSQFLARQPVLDCSEDISAFLLRAEVELGVFNRSPVVPAAVSRQLKRSLIVIGSSTGGIEALSTVLQDFPKLCPPTLVVQHVRESYLPGIAGRLNRVCAAEVTMAEAGCLISPGQVLIARSNSHHLVVPRSLPGRVRLDDGDLVSGHRPSVDKLFMSAAKHGPRAIGVLLTGMGRDGADGLLEIRKSGGKTIAQDQATSTVYGMPRIAAEIGAAQQILPIDKIGKAILAAASTDQKELA